MAVFKGSNHDTSRIRQLELERKKQQEAFERQKQKLENESIDVGSIDAKFATQTDYSEERLKNVAVGLLTHDEYKEKQERIELEEVKILQDEMKKNKNKRRRKRKKKKLEATKLSFDIDVDEDEDDQNNNNNNNNNNEVIEEPPKKKRKLTKNPEVDTSFLPDSEREEREREERLRLKREWLEEQERVKNELIPITYSYWDGSGHRRTMKVKKGTTIEKFLAMVRQEFDKELRGTSVGDLVFVKEDLIIPHNISFYELIISKARGKSGPLFSWDVHEDIRLVSDAKKEKEESHAAKVVERRWYERNKHIFPACRWEVYDPSKKRDEKYTIGDFSKNNNNN